MIFQKYIYRIFLFIVLANTCGCQQKNVDDGVNQSSEVEMENNSPKVNLVKQPAVIYRSTDLGKTWSSFADGIPSEATLSGIKQAGNLVYVTTDYHGIFLFQERKNTWTGLNEKLPGGLDINCIEVEAKKLLIGTLNKGIFVSTDGGLNWNSSKGNINAPIRAFFKSGDSIYAGTDIGIFESNDFGNNWSPVSEVIQILGFTTFHGKIYAATQNGAMMLEEPGSAWNTIYEGDALHDIGNDGKYIYAMTIGQELLKTQNDGRSWENAQKGIPRPPNFYTNEVQHIGNDIFSAQWIGIYHSQNNGESWKRLSGLPDATAFSTLATTDYGILAGISIR